MRGRVSAGAGLLERTLFVGAAISPLLQLLVLLAMIGMVFFGGVDEDTAEGLFAVGPLLTPLLLLPAIVACYRLRRGSNPWLSSLLLISGCLSCVGMGSILGANLLDEVGIIRIEESPWMAPFTLLFLLLIGQAIWPIALFAINLRRNDEDDAGVSAVGLVYGLLWLGVCACVVVLNLAPTLMSTINAVIFPLLLLLILVQLLWLPLLSAWLYAQRPRRYANV